ncbi:hypothetical protein [Cellulophaga baltica]|nr:hypothetical protein [Cellulophaga baltica]
MKTSMVLTALLALIGFCLWFFVLKPKTEITMEKQWQTLITSTTVESEKNAIAALTAKVSAKGGYWEVIGITYDGNHTNMSTYDGDLSQIKNITANFYWDTHTFQGTDWTPLDPQNIYIFFREK